MTAYQTRLGRYELLGKLASGGMGEIHLARLAGDGGFERLVVVKRLLPELVASEHFVAMFLDEARIAGRLSHPNVCEVHELGRDGHDYYLAMPYLEGVSVADLLGRPDARLAATVIAQAAEGLHHAHELRGKDGEPLGIVHRDVSPSNLMVTTAGVVKVLDFGIAKARGATARTEVGFIKGKYAYMSPEHVRGDELDRRSDVFALGIVAYELATGERLFRRASDFLSAKAILEEAIPRADVDAGIAAVIAKALSRDREDRYATAREMGAAMLAAVAPLGGPLDAASLAELVAVDHAKELSAQRTRQLHVIEAHQTSATTPERPRRRRRALVPLLVGASVLGAAVITLALLWGSPAPAADAPRDAAPVAVATPPPDAAPEPEAEPEIDAPPPAAKKRGYLSVDSSPYATIYLDGARLGVTPMIKKPVPAGRHTLRAVTEDGRQKRISVDVPPGRLATPLNLTW